MSKDRFKWLESDERIEEYKESLKWLESIESDETSHLNFLLDLLPEGCVSREKCWDHYKNVFMLQRDDLRWIFDNKKVNTDLEEFVVDAFECGFFVGSQEYFAWQENDYPNIPDKLRDTMANFREYCVAFVDNCAELEDFTARESRDYIFDFFRKGRDAGAGLHCELFYLGGFNNH